MTTTRWNRHRADCTGISARTGLTCSGCERGSKDRHQLFAYAQDVLMALTGGTCPLTGKAFDHISDGEVDRVNPSLGYVPGNVILTSKAGNQARGELQSIARDLPNVSRYVTEVSEASATVAVMSQPAATRRWYAARDAANDATSILSTGRYA